MNDFAEFLVAFGLKGVVSLGDGGEGQPVAFGVYVEEEDVVLLWPVEDKDNNFYLSLDDARQKAGDDGDLLRWLRDVEVPVPMQEMIIADFGALIEAGMQAVIEEEAVVAEEVVSAVGGGFFDGEWQWAGFKNLGAVSFRDWFTVDNIGAVEGGRIVVAKIKEWLKKK